MASKTTNRLVKIDGATNTVLGSYVTGSEPFGVAVNQNTRKVFVANYAGNSLSIFNGDTGALLATINFAPLGYGQPSFVAIDETLNRAYVTLHAGGRLAVIDGAQYVADHGGSGGRRARRSRSSEPAPRLRHQP